jgi:membrane-bound lytic murein transglycosylase MltF
MKLLVILLVFIYTSLGNKPTPQLIVPKPKTIQQICIEKNIDYQVIHKQIDVESSWRPHVVSDSGAVGLMQVRPETAGDLRKRPVSTQELKDSIFNVETGVMYIQFLSRFFAALGYKERDLNIVTWAAYYDGPGNTLKRQFPKHIAKKLCSAYWYYHNQDLLPSAVQVTKAKSTVYTNKIGI